jgi:hypothetical protein
MYEIYRENHPMETQLYNDYLCQVLGQTKGKTKAFRCVSYLDRRIFRTNVKAGARRWFMISPNVVLVVHTKDVFCTPLVPDDILLVLVQMKKNTLKFIPI